MTTQLNHNITTQRATDLLKQGQPLTNVYIDEKLKIETNGT